MKKIEPVITEENILEFAGSIFNLLTKVVPKNWDVMVEVDSEEDIKG